MSAQARDSSLVKSCSELIQNTRVVSLVKCRHKIIPRTNGLLAVLLNISE